ncbi:unnamed protein product, partial [Iphiclides podalirius]
MVVKNRRGAPFCLECSVAACNRRGARVCVPAPLPVPFAHSDRLVRTRAHGRVHFTHLTHANSAVHPHREGPRQYWPAIRRTTIALKRSAAIVPATMR